MPVPLVIPDKVLHLAQPDTAQCCLRSYKDNLGLTWSALPYVQSLAEHPCQCLFVYCFAVSRCLLPNLMLLPLYRPLPYRGVRSRRAAGTVLSSDGSDNRAAISRRLNKE